MSKFHINKNGVPAPCRATKGNCPLGGEGQHFESKQEAQEYADKKNEENYGLIKGIKRAFGIGQIKADNIYQHREVYLKKKVKGDPQEKLDSLVYAINTIEEEDGKVGKTNIGKKARIIHSFDDDAITPERRFSDLIDKVNELPEEERSRYFNKLDSILGVDSTSGFNQSN